MSLDGGRKKRVKVDWGTVLYNLEVTARMDS